MILSYVKNYVEKIDILKEKSTYTLGNITFSTPIKHIHGVETYGLNIQGKNHSLSMITDTQYFEGLESHYTGDILVINVVFFEERKDILHLCVDDVEKIIATNKPKLCIITHFGMTMLKAKPWEIAQHLSDKYGVEVIAARDGMDYHLDSE